MTALYFIGYVAGEQGGSNLPLKSRFPNELKNKFLECILDPCFIEILIFKTDDLYIEINYY